MRELDSQYWRLSNEFGLSLEQINRVIVQPRTCPEWIERTEGDVALVGNSARKPEKLESRRTRSGRDRLNLSADDKEFLQAVGVAIEVMPRRSS